MNAYNIVLSDGKHVRMESTCAADAIATALNIYRGRTVKRCYQGFDAQDVKATRGCVGGAEIEVPPHHPLPYEKDPAKFKRTEETITFPFMTEP